MSIKTFIKDSYKSYAISLWEDPIVVILGTIFAIVLGVVILVNTIYIFVIEPLAATIFLFIILTLIGIFSLVYFHGGRLYDLDEE